MPKLSTLICGALAATAYGSGNSYTASFDETTTGVFGAMMMKIAPAEMFFSYSIDFSNYETTCDLSQGLTYHVHSFWTDSETSSIKTCGDAGGHYDPYLACGPSSQEHSGLCTSLNRTADQGYTYGCSVDAYASGKYYACEAGDLSGKFGRMMPSPTNSNVFVGQFADPSPVLAVNYGHAEGIANQWASLVLHCPADNSRLACAQFIRDKCFATSC